jgi:hypothetical protein
MGIKFKKVRGSWLTFMGKWKWWLMEAGIKVDIEALKRANAKPDPIEDNFHGTPLFGPWAEEG